MKLTSILKKGASEGLPPGSKSGPAAGQGEGCVLLSELPAGVPARLCNHETPQGIRPRLRDLGLVAGTPLVVVRSAPLRDPVEIELRGYRLCLRRLDLSSICVTPAKASS